MGQVLEGRRTLIIGGGGGGIGRAITRAFAAAGSALAVVDIDRQRADEAAADAAAAGIETIAIVGDVRSSADIDRVIGDAARELGALDIVVTVVGGQLAFVPAARIHEITDEDWSLVFDVNCTMSHAPSGQRCARSSRSERAGRSSASARLPPPPAVQCKLRTAPRRRGYRA